MKRINALLVMTALIGSASAMRSTDLKTAHQKIIKGDNYIIINKSAPYKAQKNLDNLDKPRGDTPLERSTNFERDFAIYDLTDESTPSVLKLLKIEDDKMALDETPVNSIKEAKQKWLLSLYSLSIPDPYFIGELQRLIETVKNDETEESDFTTPPTRLETGKYLVRAEPGKKELKMNIAINNEFTLADIKFKGFPKAYETLDEIKADIDNIKDGASMTVTNGEVTKTKVWSAFKADADYDTTDNLQKLKAYILK